MPNTWRREETAAGYTEEMVQTGVRNGLADLRSGSEVAWAVAETLELVQAVRDKFKH